MPSIAECLEQQRLRPVFQPIGSLSTGEVLGYEALIRGPAGTPLESPLALFREAARAGCLVRLERLASRIAIAAFMRARLPGKLFINYSADSLREIDASRDEVRAFLDGQGMPSSRIVVELTEQAPLGPLDTLAAAISSIRSRGAQFAIDDYGTGHANLGQWIALKPDYIKVAREVVDGAAESPFKLEALRALRRLATVSDTALIAEGIENEADLLACRDIGFDLAQGYLLARPTDAPPLTLSEASLRALRLGPIAVLPGEAVSEPAPEPRQVRAG
ncbi:EAL domain-containing protein [Cupriavidus plantarum]|uniref:EAL domain-containing protein (Putative c-di-GMP-specific phosphodiesterase class I) n=1 Tax=Cupriavidus plantarum TaxID=942865 RepID=A0A316ETF9_9BURK|nr:EAL domain-containing protein [Cupriavidus plantarum]NYI01874.1 EAL domain-containing protein (putative c-di-GMP-specific phosphodiesterase class I) [Cupriavidus plantarum]PWK34007.1 EAL domain-containing protein (putative c-di-GMP-specific phosphodiesterase class I) [Cupriavidus plantarum]REE91180.1 EAL domain-containing protein (putative c-di-GMP-specific phosphodiesterase class I) [Cupriavidus plantarum]RLK31535.1 EAL domain-containing protein (putative c-di-GMP-specific phosphodiesterase